MNAAAHSLPAHFTYGRLLIDGEWVEANSGDRLEVINPAAGTAFASLGAGGAADVDAAVAAARRAFDDGRWLKLSPAERGRILFRVADRLEAEIDTLAELETRDNGMPIVMARGLVMRSAEMFRYFGGWTTKMHGQTTEMVFAGQPMLAYTLKEPVGVAGLITPWNVPIVSAAQKVAVALAAGCAMVLKPAEEASLTSLRLGALLQDAGVPPGVVNIITGVGEIAGAALTNHPDVDKISFTGSGEVGRSIIRAAADTNLKRITLELGGKSPVVVFDDADIDEAAAGAARGVFRNSGQVCAAGSRLYVHEKVYDAVIDGVARAAGALAIGDGLDTSTDMGPLISAAHRQRVQGLIASGLGDGAELITGGEAPDRPGYFLEPTILGSPPADSRVIKEEIFGRF